MLGNNIKIFETDNEFEKTRCLLIEKTAGFSILRDRFLQKNKLKNLTPKKIKEKLIFADILDSDMDKIVISASNELGLNRIVFEDFISGWIKEKVLDYVSLPFYVSSADKPLPEGFYIKINPETTKKTVLKTFKFAQDMWEDHIKGSTNPNSKVTRRERKIDNLEYKIQLFSIIEETILKKLKDAKDPKYFKDEDQLQSLVNDSIKFASEELYRKVRFEYAHDVYYALLKHYNVPSYTDFNKLLISLSL